MLQYLEKDCPYCEIHFGEIDGTVHLLVTLQRFRKQSHPVACLFQRKFKSLSAIAVSVIKEPLSTWSRYIFENFHKQYFTVFELLKQIHISSRLTLKQNN